MNPVTTTINITLVVLTSVAALIGLLYFGLKLIRSIEVPVTSPMHSRYQDHLWSTTTYGQPTRVVVVSDADGIDRIYSDAPDLVTVVDVYDGGDAAGPEADQPEVLPMSKLPGWVSTTLADADLAGWPSSRKSDDGDEA